MDNRVEFLWQLNRRKRLGQAVEDAFSDRINGCVDRRIAADHERRQIRVVPLRDVEQFDPRHGFHDDIGDQQIKSLALQAADERQPLEQPDHIRGNLHPQREPGTCARRQRPVPRGDDT